MDGKPGPVGRLFQRLVGREAGRETARGGRPKLPPEARRSEQVNLRFTPPELDEIQAAAEQHGMSGPDLIRSAVFAHLRGHPGPLPLPVSVPVNNPELQHKLSRIGANLNQIARVLNRRDDAPIPAGLDAVIAELGRRLEEQK